MRTPTYTDIAKAMMLCPEDYRMAHFRRENADPVRGCDLGTVFLYDGEYHIYVGVNARGRKLPLIAYRISDGLLHRFPVDVFNIVRHASLADRRQS